MAEALTQPNEAEATLIEPLQEHFRKKFGEYPIKRNQRLGRLHTLEHRGSTFGHPRVTVRLPTAPTRWTAYQ